MLFSELMHIYSNFSAVELDNYFCEVFEENFKNAVNNKDTISFQYSLSMIKYIDFTQVEYTGDWFREYAAVQFYKGIEDWSNYAERSIMFIENFEVADKDKYNIIMNLCLHTNNIEYFKKADNWAAEMLSNKLSFSSLVACAYTRHKCGDKKTAQEHIITAYDYAGDWEDISLLSAIEEEMRIVE